MFWLDDMRNHLAERIDSGAMTHAIMLAGAPGMGKRVLASELAARFLGLAAPRGDTPLAQSHPDPRT